MNSVPEVYFKYKDDNLIRSVNEIGIIEDATFVITQAAVCMKACITN